MNLLSSYRLGIDRTALVQGGLKEPTSRRFLLSDLLLSAIAAQPALS